MVRQELSSPHRLRDLAVDGNDLIELGFRPGPQLGRILHDLLDSVVDEPVLNTRAQLLALAKGRL
jgi:tRNA nucleotidyltransferase (CCA-adding enzyme)